MRTLSAWFVAFLLAVPAGAQTPQPQTQKPAEPAEEPPIYTEAPIR